eukprot:Hpha_TRINITY_DN15182_c0_g1::TRINITY_DN15182_c0_g1_i2::g.128465::m.128465
MRISTTPQAVSRRKARTWNGEYSVVSASVEVAWERNSEGLERLQVSPTRFRSISERRYFNPPPPQTRKDQHATKERIQRSTTTEQKKRVIHAPTPSPRFRLRHPATPPRVPPPQISLAAVLLCYCSNPTLTRKQSRSDRRRVSRGRGGRGGGAFPASFSPRRERDAGRWVRTVPTEPKKRELRVDASGQKATLKSCCAVLQPPLPDPTRPPSLFSSSVVGEEGRLLLTHTLPWCFLLRSRLPLGGSGNRIWTTPSCGLWNWDCLGGGGRGGKVCVPAAPPAHYPSAPRGSSGILLVSSPRSKRVTRTVACLFLLSPFLFRSPCN